MGELAALDHPGLEATGGLVAGIGGDARLEIEEALQGFDLGDLEVVAGDDPDLGASIHGGDQLGLEVFEAAGLDEGGDDADAVGVGEEREDVPGEGIVGAAGGERRRFGVGAGRQQVADAAFGSSTSP